ncbi:winged helix-turn-helix transcriptional regulator [Burkholderia alba]|uniref:winged helix-turn-helix transcriptional regulator n=1 Tax=Burkholderia alba TaxID=2683677 RepID=UPI002B0545BF|nr:winged helix-turn-helix domain-containing protein [Burkholderia alba]
MNKYKRLVILSANASLIHTVSEKIKGSEYKQHMIHSGAGLANRVTDGVFCLMLVGYDDVKSPDGQALLARRKSALIGMPIVVVMPDEEDEISGIAVLDAGADAFVAATASRSFFMSYVGALVRRAEIGTGGLSSEVYGGYEFDLLGRRIFLFGESVPVNTADFYLCLLLFRNLGRLLPANQIAESIWGDSAESAAARIRMAIVSLKRKLKLGAEGGYLIKSIRGYGYRLDAVEPVCASVD